MKKALVIAMLLGGCASVPDERYSDTLTQKYPTCEALDVGHAKLTQRIENKDMGRTGKNGAHVAALAASGALGCLPCLIAVPAVEIFYDTRKGEDVAERERIRDMIATHCWRGPITTVRMP